MTIFVVPVSKYKNGTEQNNWSIGRLARTCGLNFTAFERFENKIIALDGLKSKLLLLRQINNKISYCILNLKQVDSVLIKKTYNSIEAGSLNKRSLDYYLDKLYLRIGLANSGKFITLPFYERGEQPVNNVSSLERKAANWAKLITGMKTLLLGDMQPQTPGLLPR